MNKCIDCGVQIHSRSKRCKRCDYDTRIGKKRPEHSKLMKEKQLGSGNSNWKGDDVGYAGLHIRIRRDKPKPLKCEKCDKPPLDIANKSGKYLDDVNDWMWLCRKCHMKSDGRLEKFKNLPKDYLQRDGKGRFRSDKNDISK